MFTNLAILGAPPCRVSPKKPSCVLRLRHWWMRICTACGHWSWKTFPPQAGPRATGRPGQVPVPGTHPGVISGGSPYFTTIKGRYPLVMTNIAMEAMAHRNRWFTYLKWWFSMAMLNKQMVTFKFSYPQKDLTSIWTYLNTIWRYTPCGWGTVVLSSFFFELHHPMCHVCLQPFLYAVGNVLWDEQWQLIVRLFKRCSQLRSVTCYWIVWIHVVVSLFLPLSWHLYAPVDTQTSTDIWTQGSEF
jgi:hypothetical protein